MHVICKSSIYMFLLIKNVFVVLYMSFNMCLHILNTVFTPMFIKILELFKDHVARPPAQKFDLLCGKIRDIIMPEQRHLLFSYCYVLLLMETIKQPFFRPAAGRPRAPADRAPADRAPAAVAPYIYIYI